MNFKTSYIIPEPIFVKHFEKHEIITPKEDFKKKEKNTKSSSKKTHEPLKKSTKMTTSTSNDTHERAPILPPKIFRGSTELSQLRRYQFKGLQRQKNNLLKDTTNLILRSNIPDTNKNDMILKLFPETIRLYISRLLSFIEKEIPLNILSWNKKNLEMKINNIDIPNSNLLDILNYLYGVGRIWQTSYTKSELIGKREYLKDFKAQKIRFIPRVADTFYFVLKKFTIPETPTRLFSFNVPNVFNLIKFHYTMIRNPRDENVVGEMHKHQQDEMDVYGKEKLLADEDERLKQSLLIDEDDEEGDEEEKDYFKQRRPKIRENELSLSHIPDIPSPTLRQADEEFEWFSTPKGSQTNLVGAVGEGEEFADNDNVIKVPDIAQQLEENPFSFTRRSERTTKGIPAERLSPEIFQVYRPAKIRSRRKSRSKRRKTLATEKL